jgi:NAD(P)-dependent dehydrogenase (short-subunit alcohol dehydrogenase family)
LPSAIITGAGSGIGRETARCLSRAGFDLTVVGRRPEMLTELAADLRAESPASVLELPFDVSKRGVDTKIVAAHLACFGRVDALVTAAGVYREAPMDVLDASWDSTFDINLRGSALLAVRAARSMADSGGGRIVLIASVSAYSVEVDALDYCAAKAGIVSVAKSMALQFAGSNVTTNAIAPGWIDTPQAAEAIQELDPKDIIRINPLGRFGRPEEIAEVIRYLICDAPPFLLGTTIAVDGGQLAQAPLV